MQQLWLTEPPVWFRVDKFDARAAALADRHYSRQTVGAEQCLGPGQTLLLITPCELAVWGVVCGLDPVGNLRWRNTLFHNESSTLSSELIRIATTMTYQRWDRAYGGRPGVLFVELVRCSWWRHVATGVPALFVVNFRWIPLTTEVDIEATQRRRSKKHPPGHCYRVAGWTQIREMPAGHGRSAKLELMAP